MGYIHQLFNFTFIMLFTLLTSSLAMGDINATCSDIEYRASDASQRAYLLRNIQHKLVTDATASIANIREVRDFWSACTNTHCRASIDQFQDTISSQMYVSKIIKAINEKGGISGIRSRSHQMVQNILTQIKNNSLRPEQVGEFNINGFTYSHEDKQRVLKLWTNIFVRVVNSLPPRTRYFEIRDGVKDYFKQSAHHLVSLNPLLAFLNEDSLRDRQGVIDAFDKLIEFNQSFLETAQNYQTRHSNSYWSYLNLTVPDHEMGLVNFPNQADQVILRHTQLAADRPILCNAWADLKRQQRARIRTSIGVGFATAVLCGVGIWSGVGTLAAAAYCSFAIADSLWGARRGFLDAQTAEASLYAGVQLLDDGTFSEGFLTPQESATQTSQGHIVFMINMLGLIPIGRAIATAGGATRGSVFQLFKLPGADLTVATIESKSSNIAYVLLLLRGSEAIQRELTLETETTLQHLLVAYAN